MTGEPDTAPDLAGTAPDPTADACLPATADRKGECSVVQQCFGWGMHTGLEEGSLSEPFDGYAGRCEAQPVRFRLALTADTSYSRNI
jgi:hypothetical protein